MQFIRKNLLHVVDSINLKKVCKLYVIVLYIIIIYQVVDFSFVKKRKFVAEQFIIICTCLIIKM